MEILSMKEILTGIAVAITFAMYIPLWHRILKRRTTGDHSKITWLGILCLQGLGWSVSYLDNAQTLYLFYYPAQALVVTTTIVLVWLFYD